MKLTGKVKWARLTALMLALALFLTGCGGPGAGAGDTPETEPGPATATPEPAPAVTDPAETDPADTNPVETDPAETDPTEGLSEEELALLQRTGLAEDEETVISSEQAAQINGVVAGMRSAYVAGPGGKDPLVEERDWSVYSSELAKEKLSKKEAAYYDRLDKLCREYLSTSGLDGVRYEYSDGSVYYATEGVRFNDLGLSKDQAADVYYWFRYGNPQYYFVANGLLSSSDSLYPCMYETMADGEDRAKITNKLFDKLDGWIQTVADNSSTTYQKELNANSLLCTAVVYQREYIGNFRVDQSLYSTVMLESTVCAGYSMAFTAMMSALGVDAAAGLGGGHAWNVVRFDDGNYYAVDVCWNDTDNSSIPYKTDYLNVGESYLHKSDYTRECHTYSDDVAAWIPAIAKDSYVPTVDDLGTDVTPPQNIQISEKISVLLSRKYSQLNFSWDGADDSYTSYEFEVYNDAGYTKQTTHRSLKQRSTLISTLSLETTYYFRIRAVKEIDGEKYYSEWVSFSYTTGADTGSSPSPSPTPTGT